MGEYYGYENAFITGLGFRVKGERPSAVLKSEEFSKSLLDDENYYYDEYGRRKKKVTELQDISVDEISYVDVPATKMKFSVIKGLKGDDKMKKSDFKWSDNCQRIIRGFSDSDLEECDYEEEIEKSSNTNPFPSLSLIFNRNKKMLEEVYEEYLVSKGEKFI